MTEAAQARQDTLADTAQPDPVDVEIAMLIAQDSIITSREKALKKLKDGKRARLLILMQQKGTTRRQTAEGTASLGESTTYEVHDTSKLQELFTADVLIGQVKVGKDFWDAAKKAHIKIHEAVTPVVGPRFKVEARKTQEAKQIQSRIMDETRYEMEQRVDRLAKLMMEANANARSE